MEQHILTNSQHPQEEFKLIAKNLLECCDNTRKEFLKYMTFKEKAIIQAYLRQLENDAPLPTVEKLSAEI